MRIIVLMKEGGGTKLRITKKPTKFFLKGNLPVPADY
jgi:hypothetical protein